MRLTILLMIAIFSLLPLTALQLEQNDANLEDNPDSSRSSRNCDPFFNITLESLTYTPDEQIKLEVVLSCMDYQSIYDIDGDDKMDFDLQVRLYEINTGNYEQVWFANLDSKNCVGFNCVLWDFDNYSTTFTEMFYINGAINNDAENDDDLWPPQINNLTPHTNYFLDVSLISKNETTIFYSEHKNASFSIVPSSNPQPCTPFLKTYATDDSMPNESQMTAYYTFRFYNDIIYNHLYLGCVDPLESYQVTWVITLYQSGDEVEVGWWNVSGVEYANKTISRSVEAIHDFNGWMAYGISGSVNSSSGESVTYYPESFRGYSYDPYNIDVRDADDDGIEDTLDNCILVPNPNQANLDDDAQGDACDGDIDGDGVYNSVPLNTADSNNFDACPYVDSSGMDEDEDGCIDQIEPVECEVCKEPVKGNESNTLLDSGDMGAIAVVGGSGMMFGLALAYAAMRALNLVRFERTSSNDLAHMPKRKTADLYSDHYSQRGIVRQQEMTLSARMDLDDYVTEENEGDETDE